jgi:hypothetical protein
MTDERPYLQVPMPSPKDWYVYREWVRREEEKAQENDEDERVVIIQV